MSFSGKGLSMGLLIAAMALLPRLVSAQTVHICWVEKVKLSGDGIDVYFPADRRIIISDGKNSTWYLTGDLPKGAVQVPGSIEIVPFVHARVGNNILAFNGAENGCSMDVVSTNGQLGVEAHASFHPPGAPSSEASDYIPAEQR